MGKLLINSLYYQGEKFYYNNEDFQKGINLVVGDNENGKSTFTYLLIYGLGLEVDYFNSSSDEPINEIVEDSNQFIEVEISINNLVYKLKRKIGQNVITIYDIEEQTHSTYSLIRNGYIYKKEGKTFSDWILEKLGIDIIEITQNSSTHKVNFEDLMRYVYYDQVTDNRKIINEFGIKSNDFYRNSNLMKRSIFEVLMSGYNEEFYSMYYELKDLNKKIQEEKETKKSLEIVKANILEQARILDNEDINERLQEIRKEIRRLDDIREEIKKEGSFGIRVVDRLTELQKKVVALTHKIKNVEFKISIIEEDLLKSKRVGEETKSDIEHIDKILFTSQYIDIINEDNCPFCLEPTNIDVGHCICGSDKHLDFSRFIYSDKEYIEIIKSKVKSLETINSTILDYKKEYDYLTKILFDSKRELELTMEEIRNITKDLAYNSNSNILDEITDNIIKLKEREPELELLVEKNGEIRKSQGVIANLEKSIKKKKDKLQELEEEKDNELQENIEEFEKIYSNYLSDFYNNKEKDYEVKLDRNYMPVLGEYKHQSFNVPKRFFYYLTMLKMSIKKNIKINYPNLLIIDTMKDEGIEIAKLKKLFTYFEEFKDSDCQIIITCGYDEYSEELKPYLIEWLTNDNMLLKRRSN